MLGSPGNECGVWVSGMGVCLVVRICRHCTLNAQQMHARTCTCACAHMRMHMDIMGIDGEVMDVIGACLGFNT